MTTASLPALTWQVYAGNTTDLIAPVLIDLTVYTAINVAPTGAGIGASVNVPADGVVIDNMQGTGDLSVTIGPITTLIPRYQKATLPIPPTTSVVGFQGLNIKPVAYFFTGAFHGEGGSVNAFASQEAANVASITGGTTDAYLDSITWNKDVQLTNGYNLDNLTISGFYDVLNPTTTAGPTLPAGTWQITCLVYSASNLEIYQLARNLVSSDTQVYERRCVVWTWTPWREIGRTVTGQCQFQYASTTACKLVPLGGGLLNVNGNVEAVPFNAANGVPFVNTLTNVAGGSTLAANTQYYAYVYMSAPGVMTGEWDTKTFGLDTKGNPIKSGDPTRTCVGMVYTDANGKFQDTLTVRGVATYYNRTRRPMFYSLQASTSSQSATALIAFIALSWGVDAQAYRFMGTTANQSAGSTMSVSVNLAGTVMGLSQKSADNAGYAGALAVEGVGIPPAGVYTAAGNASVNGGTWNFTMALSADVLQ